MKLELIGLNLLKQALDGKKVDPKIKKAVKSNGAKLHQEALRLVPVDTGNLKRSITLDIEDGGATAKVQENTEYGVYVEQGTRYMAAQPYIGPAFNSVKDKFIEDLKKAVD